jgi:uncharacterized phiE125 gp8 family phage protein
MGLKLTTAPAVEPLTLAEAKAHCKVDVTDDDALLTALIVAARQLAEHLTGRALVTQQWELTLDEFPVAAIAVPLPPLQSVQSLKYRDSAGTLVTLDAAAYAVYTSALLGLIVPASGTSWPDTWDMPESVTVAFTAGYGLAVAVPQAIKQWLLLAVGGWYAHREQVVTGVTLAELPRGMWDMLLDPYRVLEVA